jgi:hypothetical protein
MAELHPIPADHDAIDLGELFSALSSRRWWILGGVGLCTALAITYVSVATPVYRASTILAPAAGDSGLNLDSALGQLGGIAAIAGISSSGGGETEESLAVLRSRDFTERFLRDEMLLPQLYPDLWDAAKNQWRVPESEQPSYAGAYRRFNNTVRSVAQDKKTGLLTLSIDWRDRELRDAPSSDDQGGYITGLPRARTEVHSGCRDACGHQPADGVADQAAHARQRDRGIRVPGGGSRLAGGCGRSNPAEEAGHRRDRFRCRRHARRGAGVVARVATAGSASGLIRAGILQF